MGRSSRVIRYLVSVVLACSATAFGAQTASDPGGSGGVEPCGDVSGQVVDAVTGEPSAGVLVTLLSSTQLTDGSGRFCFQRVPSSRQIEMSLINKNRRGKVTSCSVFEVSARFYPLFAADGERMGARIVEPGVDRSVVLSMERVASNDVDPFCVRCHRWNPCLVDDDVADLVENRKFLRGLVVSEEDSGRTSYDTCHTRHVPTAHGAYAVLPFRDGDDLCIECHAR